MNNTSSTSSSIAELSFDTSSSSSSSSSTYNVDVQSLDISSDVSHAEDSDSSIQCGQHFPDEDCELSDAPNTSDSCETNDEYDDGDDYSNSILCKDHYAIHDQNYGANNTRFQTKVKATQEYKPSMDDRSPSSSFDNRLSLEFANPPYSTQTTLPYEPVQNLSMIANSTTNARLFDSERTQSLLNLEIVSSDELSDASSPETRPSDRKSPANHIRDLIAHRMRTKDAYTTVQHTRDQLMETARKSEQSDDDESGDAELMRLESNQLLLMSALANIQVQIQSRKEKIQKKTLKRKLAARDDLIEHQEAHRLAINTFMDMSTAQRAKKKDTRYACMNVTDRCLDALRTNYQGAELSEFNHIIKKIRHD